jgi:hypothetical protein
LGRLAISKSLPSGRKAHNGGLAATNAAALALRLGAQIAEEGQQSPANFTLSSRRNSNWSLFITRP